MLSKTRWMAPTAGLVIFLSLYGVTAATVFLGAAGLSVVALVVALWQDFKPRGKYDLKSLAELEDREELANLDPNVGVFEYDDYLCPYCRTLYSMEYRTCPKCGRTRSS